MVEGASALRDFLKSRREGGPGTHLAVVLGVRHKVMTIRSRVGDADALGGAHQAAVGVREGIHQQRQPPEPRLHYAPRHLHPPYTLRA